MGFIMEPIYWAISWILLSWHKVWDLILPDKNLLGTTWDWVLAIIFLVITVRAILFPVFVKQIRSQRAMQALQPKMKELQEQYKGDRATLQQKMMELYQKEKVNPLMGCLPMFLQIPVFLGLFHILRRLSPDRPASDPKTGLYGWVYEQFHSASLANLFGAPIAESFKTGDTHVKIVAGILVIMMMVTTYMTSRQMILKTGWSVDPQQKMIQRLMLYGIPASLFISGFLYPFPIGVVIYWVTQNLFSMGQQYWVLHKYPPPLAEGAKPPAAKASGGAKGLVNGTRTGLFRRFRKADTQPETPVIDAKALAPKPGAKPVVPPKAPAQKAGAGSKATASKAAASEPAAPKDAASKDAATSDDWRVTAQDTPEAEPAKQPGGTPSKATPAKAGGQKTGAQRSGQKSAPRKSNPRKGGSKRRTS